jgi:hypothetical protein
MSPSFISRAILFRTVRSATPSCLEISALVMRASWLSRTINSRSEADSFTEFPVIKDPISIQIIAGLSIADKKPFRNGSYYTSPPKIEETGMYNGVALPRSSLRDSHPWRATGWNLSQYSRL